ncbi:MAG: hypothetical protein ABI867_32930 [Kofleriaceae bacterium]
MRDWLVRRTPRQILAATFASFLVYSWPGFIGWDSREHLLHARRGIFGDAHPPAVAWLWRIVELVVAGPAGMLLVQAIPLLAGLYLIFRHRLAARPAAVAASIVFLFPVVSGVTALICKDALMAGFVILGIGLLLHGHLRFALLALFVGSLMRWNSFPATFGPIVLLLQLRPSFTGWRRYGSAFVVWLAITIGALEVNEAITVTPEYSWFETHAIEDIAGTLQYMDDLDDATLNRILDGVPMKIHDHVHATFRARYDCSDYRQLIWGPNRIVDKPRSDGERAAIERAWKELVFDNPSAYLKFRLDNFKLLTSVDRRPSFSNVYIWFSVIAAPETIEELNHDAAGSHVQDRMREAMQWISLTPVFFTFVYLGLCLLLLPFAKRLELALLLSAMGYELAWFFFAPTSDARYSQWMVLCCVSVIALYVARQLARRVAIAAAAPSTAVATSHSDSR